MEWPEYQQMYCVEDQHWWFVSRRRLAAALIEQWIPGSDYRILDVGCGTGGNLAYLQQLGAVTGLDLSADALGLAQGRNLPGLVQASGLQLPYPAETFHLVTVFDVLYHRWVSDDSSAITELYRVLEPGGWLLITDSALPLLWSVHDEIYYARQRYVLDEMQRKLRTAGFQIRRASYTNALLLPLALLYRALAHWLALEKKIDLEIPPPWLNQSFMLARAWETTMLQRGLTFPVGSSLVCLGQKPDNAL